MDRWIDACIDKVVNWYIKLLSGRNPKLLYANTYKPFGSEISIYILKIVCKNYRVLKGLISFIAAFQFLQYCGRK